jgi:membrane fusion protein (multidrug efflux system)
MLKPTAAVFLFLLLPLIVSCGSESKGARPPGFPPAPVAITEVQPEDIPIYAEFAAQTYARDLVEVRGRVDGHIEKRLFEIGSDVQAGQVLYQLDLRPYEAAVEKAKGDLEQRETNLEFAKRQVSLIQARANLAQAEANLLKARQDVERLQPLVKQEAAAQQDLDNAEAALKANQANVDAATANVEQARLSSKAQIDTAQGQVGSSRASLRSAELNLYLREHHGPGERANRRLVGSGRRPGYCELATTPDHDRTARPDLGPIQSE